MADIFVSYARADKQRVAPLVAALEAKGFNVWWDPEITPGQEFDQLILKELRAAKATIVVWTPASVSSRWVRGEAREAADRGILVPVRFDNAELPLDVRTIHTTDLDDWRGDVTGPAFEQLLRALAALLAAPAPAPLRSAAAPGRRGVSICVLPFTNMSGDAEQEYFSDGISEDIITDLSKVSALAVTARNTAFTFKGKAVDVPQVARQTGVSHVLEGSVRKAGNKVRITAQLIDGASGNHLWAERYDRDLSDIFKLQDEISEAIVTALKIKLLPEEKKAIERRGTASTEAYDLYLMARRLATSGNFGSRRRAEEIIHLCTRAAEIDPNYAEAWTLIASGQSSLKTHFNEPGDGGLAAAERAIALNPNLADAHAIRATVLRRMGQFEEGEQEVQTALRLDPNSYEANHTAASALYRVRRFAEAVPFYERAIAASEEQYWAAAMLTSTYRALGDDKGAKRAASIVLARTEKVVAVEPDNGSAMSNMVAALAALGQNERAKEVARRAMLLDPDNLVLHYNLLCTLTLELKEYDEAFAVLERVAAKATPNILRFLKADPDLDALREMPRFQAIMKDLGAKFPS